METISLTIDGLPVRARKGQTVLEAAQAAGIYIPTLCADPDLRPWGACRICIVQIEGARGLPASCTTPATDGMVVRTDTPQIAKIRRNIVELLLAEGHDDCLVCPKNNRCDLQHVAAVVGVRERRFNMRAPSRPWDTSNPFFYRDLNKCILCAKCVRVCDEIQGVKAIDIIYRGYKATIGTFGDRPLAESNCESCGQCVAKCPVGALVPYNYEWPSREVRTVCAYCGVGCGIYLGVRGDRIVGARGDERSPVNRGNLCVKGRFGNDFVNHPERLVRPLIKKDGEFVEATWEEALDTVAEGLIRHQGDAFAAIASAKCTNEENYLIQKFARAVMGSNNVDHCARL